MLRKKITLIAVGLLFSMSSYAANSGQITFKGRIVDDRCIQTNVDELISNKVTRNACFNDIQKVSVQTSFTNTNSGQKSSKKEVLVLTYN